MTELYMIVSLVFTGIGFGAALFTMFFVLKGFKGVQIDVHTHSAPPSTPAPETYVSLEELQKKLDDDAGKQRDQLGSLDAMLQEIHDTMTGGSSDGQN